MTRIRLRLGRGYRADVLEVPFGDILLGGRPDGHVVIEGTADRHAWLRPRRGRLILAPAGRVGRRPVVAGARIEAPVVLGPEQPFSLADVTVEPTLVSDEGLAGRTLGEWAIGAEIGRGPLLRRTYRAAGRSGEARIHQLPVESWPAPTGVEAYEVGATVAWVEPGPARAQLDQLLAAHGCGDVRWPREAAVVLITQLAEMLVDHHARFGVHGALRPELVTVQADGRIALEQPDPTARALDYQPESVRLGGPATRVSDLYGWWRLSLGILEGFIGLAECRARLPRPPTDVAELLAAAEGVRRFAIETNLDPTVVHLARGAQVLVSHQAKPLAALGSALSATKMR